MTRNPNHPHQALLKQRAALLAECERRHWRELYETDELDFGIEDLERPGLRIAFETVRRGPSAGLAVTTFAPPTHLMLDLGELLAVVQDDGWALMGLFCYEIPETGLVNACATFAPVAREFIARRTSAALARRKAAGGRLGRPQKVADEVIQRLLIARWSGQSLSAIARELNEDGVPTATGRGPWQASTVKGVLTSERAKELRREVDAIVSIDPVHGIVTEPGKGPPRGEVTQ
jgi:hypothetical protein